MQTGLEPEALKVLPAGFDIMFGAPQNAQQRVGFAKLQVRGISAGLGVPEYLLTGDLTDANYSSLRAGLLEFRRCVEAVQFHRLNQKSSQKGITCRFNSAQNRSSVGYRVEMVRTPRPQIRQTHSHGDPFRDCRSVPYRCPGRRQRHHQESNDGRRLSD